MPEVPVDFSCHETEHLELLHVGEMIRKGLSHDMALGMRPNLLQLNKNPQFWVLNPQLK